MLGSLFRAAVKTITLPVSIVSDVCTSMSDAAEGEHVGQKTMRKVSSIADDLDNVF